MKEVCIMLLNVPLGMVKQCVQLFKELPLTPKPQVIQIQ